MNIIAIIMPLIIGLNDPPLRLSAYKNGPPAIENREIDGDLFLWGKERSSIAEGPHNTLSRMCCATLQSLSNNLV